MNYARLMRKPVQENFITVGKCINEKVVACEKIGNSMLIYRMIESSELIEDNMVVCYGIEIESSLFGAKDKNKVLNISSKYEIVKELFDVLTTNFVTPFCLREIVEDFLVEKYS